MRVGMQRVAVGYGQQRRHPGLLVAILSRYLDMTIEMRETPNALGVPSDNGGAVLLLSYLETVCHNPARRRNTNFHNCSQLTVSGEESLVTAIAQPGCWVHKNKQGEITPMCALTASGARPL